MKFDDAEAVEMITYQLRESDWVRGQNRSRINDLFNGAPPYTAKEVEESDIRINVNDLSSTRAGHNARAQYYSAFLRQDRFFSLKCDRGAKHKRSEYNAIVTAAIAKIMKRSLPYFECMRSKFALDVLHGIGPSAWEDRDKWCPNPLGIEDVLIPADTLLTMKNLPFYATYHSLTAPELIRMTSGPRVSSAWNMPLVERCVEWVDKEATALMGTNWPVTWAPEKAAERRMDPGFYAGDRVPTIDVYDFYFWSDEGKNSGWRRRMILDAWGTPDAQAKAYAPSRRAGDIYQRNQGFLFNGKSRKYATRLSELISFQFADLSAVSPFRYHSVRSLGKLIYAVCHLQNRLRCQFNKAVFESLMQYFRVQSEEDAQRALKVELTDRAFIDPSIKMIGKDERWQYDWQLSQLGLSENRSLIDDSTASYAQRTDYSRDRTEKTKFQVMAELQGMTAMLNAGLLQAYAYQKFEYMEVMRRFMRANSRDPDVIEFRASCLRQGVPEELLIHECWEVEPEQIMGAGNQSLQMAIAEQLLAMLPLFDPQAKQHVFRDIVFAITQDATKTKLYVPDEPKAASDSIHDAQLALGSIMQGIQVAHVGGQNVIETIEVWLGELDKLVQETNAQGGVPTPDRLNGMINLARHTAVRIVILSGDEGEKQRVKQYSDTLAKLMNEVRAFQQRLEEQQEQQGNGQMSPADMAEIQKDLIKAQAKAANTRESHAQRAAQRQMGFEKEEERKQQEHAFDLQRRAQEAQLETEIEDLKAATQIQIEKAKADAQPKEKAAEK